MRHRVHSKSHSNRKNIFMSFGFWLVALIVIALFIPRHPMIMGFTFLAIAFSCIPLFKISMKVEYSSEEGIEEVKEDISEENDFFIREMFPFSEVKPNKDGSYTLEFYPTKIHEWLNKKFSVLIEWEEKENSVHTTMKRKGELLLETDSYLEEENGRTVVKEETHSRKRSSIDQIVFTYLEKPKIKKILEENGYKLEKFDISADFFK